MLILQDPYSAEPVLQFVQIAGDRIPLSIVRYASLSSHAHLERLHHALVRIARAPLCLPGCIPTSAGGNNAGGDRCSDDLRQLHHPAGLDTVHLCRRRL
jgi:hypothetical protein